MINIIKFLQMRHSVIIGPDDLLDLFLENTKDYYINYSSLVRKKFWEKYSSINWIGHDYLNVENIQNCEYFLALKSNKKRHEIIHNILKKGGTISKLIDKSSRIFKSANIGKGVIVYPLVTISSFAEIDSYSVISYGTLIGHGVKIGESCFLAPNVKLLGDCKIGKFSMISTGSTILPGISIGDNCLIGPGITIMKNVPCNSKVVSINGSLRILSL